MNCLRCGNSNDEMARFCNKCGVALHPVPGRAGQPQSRQAGGAWKVVLVVLGGVLLFSVIGSLVDQQDTKDVTQDTPATSTEPPAPPSPEDSLRAALAESLGSRGVGKLREVRYNADPGFVKDPPAVVITFKVSDSLTAGMTKTGAEINVVEILKGVQAAKVRYNWVQIIGNADLVDRFGNSHEELVFRARYNESTVNKINWERFLHQNAFTVADDVYLHPAMPD